MALFRRRDPRSTGFGAFKAGVIAIVVIAIAVFWSFTRLNPFASPYVLHAVFRTSNNLQTDSPVRIGGVDVGKVTEVKPILSQDGVSACAPNNNCAEVTMELSDKALPLHQDAQLKIRPRVFLEGNYFVDLQQGTPATPKVGSGYTVPVNQTATPVQLDQVLASLQADTRQSLQTLLKEYAEKGLGNGGAQAWNRGLPAASGAERYSSIANEATLGEQPHDLSRLVRGQQRLFRSLSTNPQTLQDLVVQLNTTFQTLASESGPLEQAIPALDATLRVGRPALVSLDGALPSLREFSRAALPGTISSGPTIDASLPEITQLHLLLCSDSAAATACPANDTATPHGLRALVADLTPTIPALARLNADTIPFLAETRTLSACQSNVLLPFSHEPIPNPDFPSLNARPWYVVGPQAFSGLAGESRVADANTPLYHLQAQSGPTTAILQNNQGRMVVAAAPAPPIASRPAKPDQRPPFRPGSPCELQRVPDLNAPAGAPYQSVTETTGTGLLPPLPANKASFKLGQQQLNELQFFLTRQRAHQPAVDPLSVSQAQFRQQTRKLGFAVTQDGRVYSLGGAR